MSTPFSLLLSIVVIAVLPISGCRETPDTSWPSNLRVGDRITIVSTTEGIISSLDEIAARTGDLRYFPPAPRPPMEVIRLDPNWIHLKSGSRVFAYAREQISLIRIEPSDH